MTNALKTILEPSALRAFAAAIKLAVIMTAAECQESER